MRIRILVLIAGVAFLTAGPAWAGTVTVNFSACPSGQTCPGAIGTSQAYNWSGYTITAYGFQNTSSGFSGTDLYVKQSGGDESGLGISNENDHEIDPNQMIQLDLSNLANAGITSGDLMIGSVQSGEGYAVYTSGSTGVLGNLELQGTQDETYFPVSWTTTDPYLNVAAYLPNSNCNGHSDVLLMDFSANQPAPEPASLVLLATGLAVLGLGYLRLRRKAPQAHAS